MEVGGEVSDLAGKTRKRPLASFLPFSFWIAILWDAIERNLTKAKRCERLGRILSGIEMVSMGP